MKNGDIVYYVDEEGKFYFDVQIEQIVTDLEHNLDLYQCKILGNDYKFLNNEFEFKKERIGEIKRYLKSQLCENKEEAERIIN